MNVEVLECFLGGKHIGRFERRFLTTISFVYNDDAGQSLSLSLPRDQEHHPSAAKNFLANLLPETAVAKEIMREHAGADSADDFDLLSRVGGDVVGAVQLMPEGQSLAEWGYPPILARTEAVAGRIRTIKASETSAPGAGDWPMRFSLAGVQAKFALAETEGEWFWSDAGTPSTHILKPEARKQAGIERIEASAIQLARLAGLPAAEGRIIDFGGQTSFISTRFDRLVDTDGIATRLHAEDALQAYGAEVGFKYELGAEEVIDLLQSRGSSEAAYDFVRQLAFNVGVKNADAHGKNYSFLHHPDGTISLSPMYDIVPMGFFPQYEQALSMAIGDAKIHSQLTGNHWIELAAETGLDTDRVAELVTEVAAGILEHVDGTLDALDVPHLSSAVAEIKRYNEQITAGL